MADAIFIDGGLYSAFDVEHIENGDYLLLPNGNWFYVEKIDQSYEKSKIFPIDFTEGSIPSNARIVKLEVHGRVN